MILSGRQATRATDVTKKKENPSQKSANKSSDFSSNDNPIVRANHEPILTDATTRVNETTINVNMLGCPAGFSHWP